MPPAAPIKKKSPPSHPRIILLFEDNADQATKKLGAIVSAAGKRIPVRRFTDEDREPAKGSRALTTSTVVKDNFESKVEAFVGGKDVHLQVGLIVADQELTEYEHLRPASGETIWAYCKSTGIPLCLYERNMEPSSTLSITKWIKWSKNIVILTDKDPRFGDKCVSLYDGFEYIRKKLEKHGKLDTPGHLLSTILERVDLVDRISQYGAGDQAGLELLSIFDASTGSDKNKESEVLKRYPRILGQWLITSLLRFPGIFLDQRACEAYLGLREGALNDGAVAKVFNGALYHGPFLGLGPYWWRDRIDKTIQDNVANRGIDIVNATRKKAKALSLNVCQHPGEEAHPGEFVCMVNGKPVCKKHSRGGISWFPAGADLARISLKEYNKIGPFVGLY